MRSEDQSIQSGHFARKQIGSRNWLISWSHGSRFRLGLKLAQELNARRVLDYGCGDGSFLALLIDGPKPPSAAIGVEIDPKVVESCNSRFSDRRGLRFILQSELGSPEYENKFDAVICMEVLEHVVEVEPLIETLVRLLAPSGRLLISVPVETGPVLLIKQFVRRLAGWRGIGDYPGTTSYSLTELFAGLSATRKQQHVVRPVHINADGRRFHDHKGFNWMFLRGQLVRRFYLEKTLASPASWLPPFLGSQVWFVLRKK